MTSRTLVGFLLLVVAPTLAATSARAALCVDAREEGNVPVHGTVGYSAAFGAFERVAQTYGAAAMVEKRLLPMLSARRAKSAVIFDITSLLNLAKLPVCGSSEAGPGMGALDVGTGGVGLGANVGPFKLFYAGNATYRSVRGDSGWARGNLAFWLPLIGSIISPLAPLMRGYTGNAMTLHIDFIAGALIGGDVFAAGVGYVASKGLYTTLKSPISGLSASAVMALDLRSFPVATGCVDDSWLAGTGFASTVGITKICIRRLEYDAAPSGNVPAAELGSAKTGGYQFATAHLEQTGIGGLFDVSAAMTLKPAKYNFYDASIGYHSDYFRWHVGAVKTPVMYSHGAEGGLLPRAGIEVGLGEGASDGAIFMANVALNSVDVLSVFPSARNVVSFTLKVGGGMDSSPFE